MPMPLSSHTNSSGIGSTLVRAVAAALIAPGAVEWLADASPKLHTTTASCGQGRRDAELARPVERERQADRARQVRRDRRGLRDDASAAAEHLVPAAGDRVFVDGGAAPSSTSMTGVEPGTWRARAAKKPPER